MDERRFHMKIGTPKTSPLYKKQAIHSPLDEVRDFPSHDQPKQAFKDLVMQQLQQHEEQQNLTNYDELTQTIINKFNNGYKLTQKEIHQLFENAPNYAHFVEKIIQERAILENKMQLAPTQPAVQHVVYNAIKQIKLHTIKQEQEIRLKHLENAKQEYYLTDDYLTKPSHSIDLDNTSTYKPIKPLNTKRKPNQKLIDAYDSFEN